MRDLHSRAWGAALCATLSLASPLCTTAQSAESGVHVCLRSGTHVVAVRIEALEGRYRLYLDATGSPLDISADQIKSMGEPCATEFATQRFGIHGSNTIGERLMPMLIDAFAEKRYGARTAYTARAPEELDIKLEQPGKRQVVANIDLQAKGSGTAIDALLQSKATIGMSSRRATSEEAGQIAAAFKTNLFAAGSEHVLALDGLAVIVNRENPLRQLSLATVARIFAGDLQNWSQVTGRSADGHEVSGPNAAITLHARDNKSGTFDTFMTLVANPNKTPLSGNATRYESSETLSDAVAADPNAIGFIGLPYVNKNHALDIVSACGLASGPTRYAIKTEEYPLARRLYLYTVGDPPTLIARDLMQFVLSDDAQATMTEAGFVDQSIEIEDAAEQKQWIEGLVAKPDGPMQGKTIPGDAASAFARQLGPLRRTSIVFRFDPHAVELDTRAVQDAVRLASFLRSPERAGKRVVLVGFADADGSWNANMKLSNARVRHVATELRRRGVAVSEQGIMSFSYFAPVACNDSEDGRHKNRRVEVWITP